MRRVIGRGFRKIVADDCTLPGANTGRQVLTARQVEGRGISGATVPTLFDYATLEMAGTMGDGMAFKIEGYTLLSERYFRAWYTPSGILAGGFAEYEDRVGPHPEELTKWFMNGVITEHSAMTSRRPRDVEKPFKIMGVMGDPLTNREIYCVNCGGAYASRNHASNYQCCPEPSYERIPIR